MKKVQDHYFEKAKRERFAARSVYKLEEIDRRHRLLRPGMRVLDLGCRPGSWMQYVAGRVGKGGRVVGVDLRPVHTPLPAPCVVLEMDALAPDLPALRAQAERFDLVLSDMAPDTTGVKFVDQTRSMALAEAALALARQTLVPGGAFLVKVFQGPGFPELVAAVRAGFGKAVIEKPRSSRKESKELYILGLRFRGATAPERSST